MYVPDRYKTQETCDKVILENDEMLRFNSWLLQKFKNVL